MQSSSRRFRIARGLVSLALSLFSFRTLAVGPHSGIYQQDLATGTSSPGITPVLPVSETPAPENTETATATPETFTPTPDPTLTTEAAVTLTPDPDILVNSDFVSNEALIGFRGHVPAQAREHCVESANASIETEIGGLDVVLARFPDGKGTETLAALLTCPGIRYIEPNYEVHIADTIPSDPGWAVQYGLTNVRAPQGWDSATGSAAVTIAIIDSGVDLGHPDLFAKIVPGYDFVNDDPVAQDDNGHGTHVAGIAAASSNNGIGIAGVSWGARIMPVKILNAAGNGTFANLAAGITWAADQGAQVINLSVGGSNPSQVLQDAVSYAASKGVVLVAASGNAGSNFVLYPARYPEVIAVAATDGFNGHAGFSNYGPEVDLSAPGVSIYSTVIGGYDYLSGTSMAVPFVAGLAAILRGIPGNNSSGAIAWQMESTALDLGGPGVDDLYGYGLIQMDAAIRAALPASTATATASSTPVPTVTPAGTATLPVSQRDGSPPFIGFSPGRTSPTATIPPPSSGPGTESPAPTVTRTSASPASITESAEVYALEGAGGSDTPNGQNWFLPCTGTIFILAGVFLFWLARKESKSRWGKRLR